MALLILLGGAFLAYLGWLLWAALAFPLPFSYNLRSLWQRKVATFTTAGAIGLVVGIFVVVLSLNVLGDALQDYLDPRMRHG